MSAPCKIYPTFAGLTKTDAQGAEAVAAPPPHAICAQVFGPARGAPFANMAASLNEVLTAPSERAVLKMEPDALN